MENIWTQFSSLLWMMITGIVWGAYADAIHIRRSLRRIPAWKRAMGDLLFWFGSLILLGVGLILGNWMEIRFYVFCAFAFGYMVYAALIRSVVCPLFRKGFQVVGLLGYPFRRFHERIVFRRRLWWRRMKRRVAKEKGE